MTTKTWSVQSRDDSQRLEIDVLALDAEYRQTLAALRSLARSGVRVGVGACASEAGAAPALRSRWRQMSATLPGFDADPDGFVDAVLEVLDEYPARMILPCHDGSIHALRRRRREVERRTFFPFASEAALDIAVSKTRTLALATALGIAIPKGVVVTDESDVRAAVREFGYPVVVKPASSWGRGKRLVAQAPVNLDEALREVEKIHAAGLQALVQQWLPGRRDAVSFFCTSGRIWARFAQTSHREFPPLGGVSVLSESISPLRDIVEPAEALVRAADLDGCSMVEFRRDREGHPVLMEVNSRLPGSVALAISAGVDFPQLLYTWASGKPLREIPSYRVGLRQRSLSGDISHLKYVFEGPKRTDTPSKGRAVATFLYDFIRRPSAIDGVDRSDLLPSLVELRHGILEPILGKTLRVALGRSRKIPGRTEGAKEV